MQEFRYEISWPATGNRPGHHRSGRLGAGFEFRNHAPLVAHPDPRRLDLHASLKDPFGGSIVRVFRQRSAITVYILADLSASMGFIGTHAKLDVLADFSGAAAYSAYRTGDAFGFIGADGAVLERMWLAPSRSKGMASLIAERLRRFVPAANSATGLLAAAQMLGRHRALVFLASDFHFPLGELQALLSTLSPHHVVPVVLWDRAEYTVLPKWGIGMLMDSETGQRRTVFLRPSLHQRLLQAYRDRQSALRDVFLRYGRRPLELLDEFVADQVTEYFLAAHASRDVS